MCVIKYVFKQYIYMYVCINWGVLKWRYPQIIQFIVDFRMVDYKPAIGVPLFDGNHHISICIYIYIYLYK